MKKALAWILLWFLLGTECYAEDKNTMDGMMEDFSISSFVQEAEKYSGEFLAEEDMNDLLGEAILGKVDNTSFLKKIFQGLGKEVRQAVTTLRKHYDYYCYTQYLENNK